MFIILKKVMPSLHLLYQPPIAILELKILTVTRSIAPQREQYQGRKLSRSHRKLTELGQFASGKNYSPPSKIHLATLQCVQQKLCTILSQWVAGIESFLHGNGSLAGHPAISSSSSPVHPPIYSRAQGLHIYKTHD